MSGESLFKFVKNVIPDLEPSEASDFFDLLTGDDITSPKNHEIVLKVLVEARELWNRSKKSISYPLCNFIPGAYCDFTACHDNQFQEMVHVTRNTAKSLVEYIRGTIVGMEKNSEIPQNDEPVDKMLYLLLWYLRNENKKIEDAVSLFELGTIENANKLLNQGLANILKLKTVAGLFWPTSEEFSHTATCIQRTFWFPDVAAVMGHRIFTCDNGQSMMLQAVCNEKNMFIDLYTSFDTRPRRVFKQSMLKDKIQDLNNGLVIVSEAFNVANKFKKNIVFPYEEGSLESTSEEQIFNIMHEFIMGILEESFNHLLTRFPKLKLLDRCEPDIITTACILHNFCIKLNDLTPL